MKRNKTDKRFNGRLMVKSQFVLLCVIVVTIFCQLTGAPASSAAGIAAARWRPGNEMPSSRFATGAVALPSKRMMLVGGMSINGELASTAIYDSARDIWKEGPDLPQPHYGPATFGRDGEVFVVGNDSSSGRLTRCFSYSEGPGQSAQWIERPGPSFKRHNATVSYLPMNNAVLLVGGDNGKGDDYQARTFASVEIFFYQINGWRQFNPMGLERTRHTATVLANGNVLVIGGLKRETSHLWYQVEMLNAQNGQWVFRSTINLPRYAHTATLLKSGKVLVIGGISFDGKATNSVEIYNPETDMWEYAPPMHTARAYHTTTLLPSGQIVVIGGESEGVSLDSVEVFDPSTRTWSSTNSLSIARSKHSTVAIDSQVIVVGGMINAKRDTASVEILDLDEMDIDRPTISGAGDMIVIAKDPGQIEVKVNYPIPEVAAKSPLVSFNCSPASGSLFRLGTTKVMCSARDQEGLTSSAAFYVTVWDVCLRDDQTGDLFYVNSVSGEYQLKRCSGKGVVINGTARVEKQNCVIKLTDKKLSVNIQTCEDEKSVSKVLIEDEVIIKDSDITDNAPTCVAK